MQRTSQRGPTFAVMVSLARAFFSYFRWVPKVLERYLVLLEGCLVVPSIVLSHSLLHVLCTQAISSLVGPPPPASAEVRAARSGSIPPLLIKSVIDVVMSMLKCILADQGSMLSDIPIARS